VDWSIIGGILAGAAAVWAAVYTLVRERAPMRELERVTAVLKDTPDQVAYRAYLEAVRDHLFLRINFAYRAPREVYLLTLGWTGLAGGLLFFIFLVYVESGRETALPTWASLALGLINGGIVAIGQLALYSRWRSRQKWLKDIIKSNDKMTTNRSLV